MFIERVSDRRAAQVSTSWARIKAWLRGNLPETLADLCPGASAALIEEFENTIGRRLPDDVRESWRIHNGQEGFNIPGVIFGSALLPLSHDKFSNVLST